MNVSLSLTNDCWRSLGKELGGIDEQMKITSLAFKEQHRKAQM